MNDEEVDVRAAVVRGSNVLVSYVVPLIVGICLSAGNVSSAVSFPVHLRSMDKMCLDSPLMSVLLVDIEAQQHLCLSRLQEVLG